MSHTKWTYSVHKYVTAGYTGGYSRSCFLDRNVLIFSTPSGSAHKYVIVCCDTIE